MAITSIATVPFIQKPQSTFIAQQRRHNFIHPSVVTTMGDILYCHLFCTSKLSRHKSGAYILYRIQKKRSINSQRINIFRQFFFTIPLLRGGLRVVQTGSSLKREAQKTPLCSKTNWHRGLRFVLASGCGRTLPGRKAVLMWDPAPAFEVCQCSRLSRDCLFPPQPVLLKTCQG